MKKPHEKSSVLYYLTLIFLLFALFFSNDFNLTDVQKTAIVMAVGIDREDDHFLITSQIALPKPSKQGQQSETVQLVSRGKTVADALEEINAKTGWYPKLVFCHLIVLGEKTVQQDVFDALGFFLLDEYLSDNCLVATCEGSAQNLLNVSALVDSSGSVAMQKVLSAHAERVGLVLPATLRQFAIGYYSDSKSAYLPILKTQPQQEIGENSQKNSGEKNGKSGENNEKNQENQESKGENSEQNANKPVFSASETALFVGGKMVGKWTKEETFAFNAVKTKLRLASYSVAEREGESLKNAEKTSSLFQKNSKETLTKYTTLTIKNNARKTKFSLLDDGRASAEISITLSAGLLDSSSARVDAYVKDAGGISENTLKSAEKLLKSQIVTAFEKSRALGCDLFELNTNLFKKYNKKIFREPLKTKGSAQTDFLKTAVLRVDVRFKNIR